MELLLHLVAKGHRDSLHNREHGSSGHNALQLEAGRSQQGAPLRGVALPGIKHEHHVQVTGCSAAVEHIRRGMPRWQDHRLINNPLGPSALKYPS